MAKITLNDTFSNLRDKLASTASSCASSVKIRMELASEESRQSKRYEQLGEKVLKAVVENNFEALKDDPSVVELVGAIQEKKLLIKELEEKLKRG